MKTCLYCEEETKKSAVECKYCGSMLINDTPLFETHADNSDSVVKGRTQGQSAQRAKMSRALRYFIGTIGFTTLALGTTILLLLLFGVPVDERIKESFLPVTYWTGRIRGLEKSIKDYEKLRIFMTGEEMEFDLVEYLDDLNEISKDFVYQELINCTVERKSTPEEVIQNCEKQIVGTEKEIQKAREKLAYYNRR